MTSMNASDIFVSATNGLAVFKERRVAVCTVDKTEVNLTRQDLVELINVCSIYLCVCE